MSLGFIQAQSATAASATAVTVNITTSAGSMLVIFTTQRQNNTSTVTMSDSSGSGTWSQTVSGYISNGTTNRSAMWVKPNSAAVTTITATWVTLTTTIEMIVFEVSGGVVSSAEDSSVNNTENAVTTATSGSLTTTNATDILVMGTGLSGAFTSPTAGTGYTLPTNGFQTRCIMEYQIVSSTQTGVTAQMSWTNSLNDASVFAGFKGIATSAAPLWSQLPTSGPSYAI